METETERHLITSYAAMDEHIRAIAEFVDELSISYRKLSGEGVQEVMRLATDRFGVPWSHFYPEG